MMNTYGTEATTWLSMIIYKIFLNKAEFLSFLLEHELYILSYNS